MVPYLILLLGLLLRLAYILPAAHPKKQWEANKGPIKGHVMVLLGSGGHTGEMLRLLAGVNLDRCKKTWLVSSGDSSLLEKIKGNGDPVLVLKRARRVGQPLLTSVLTTMWSFLSFAVSLLRSPLPDLVLLNGPGTCVPVAYTLFALKYLGVCSTKIVYVESLARVDRLSLSGLLVLPIANRFLVQWRQLTRYRRAEYHGILV